MGGCGGDGNVLGIKVDVAKWCADPSQVETRESVLDEVPVATPIAAHDVDDGVIV